METSTKGKALPFITFHEKQGFILNKEAEEFLKSLDDSPLGIVSVVGKYRTGKSFFINRVLLNAPGKGFNVGPTVNPCTKVNNIP
jgi:hypothetical protein